MTMKIVFTSAAAAAGLVLLNGLPVGAASVVATEEKQHRQEETRFNEYKVSSPRVELLTARGE